MSHTSIYVNSNQVICRLEGIYTTFRLDLRCACLQPGSQKRNPKIKMSLTWGTHYVEGKYAQMCTFTGQFTKVGPL